MPWSRHPVVGGQRCRRWGVPAAIAVLTVGLVQGMPPVLAQRGHAGVTLVERSSIRFGYAVRLPSTWRFENASYPSDHATLFWYNPANALQRMYIIESACWGCAHNLTTGSPEPTAVLADVTSNGGEILHTYRLGADRLAYEAFVEDDPYDMNGLVIVAPKAASGDSYVDVQLWLPTAQHGLATTILNSFRTST